MTLEAFTPQIYFPEKPEFQINGFSPI